MIKIQRSTLSLGVALVAFFAVAADAKPQVVANEAIVDFDRNVRPILSNTCFVCHGPDENNRKAKLRLDVKSEVFAKRRGYFIIAPGQPEKSELYLRITAKDKVERMPPAKSHKQLNSQQIALVRAWIEQGAKWEEHWAFVAPKKPPLPTVKNTDWPKNEIDYFILSRIEKAGLQPSPPASREKWIRRVTLDLTGLPPTLAEIDSFLKDSEAKPQAAYERVVDRLLASPRYGEHMALTWLDAARYADTNGYQQDRTRTMWPWRDWLIRALNDNMPYDQFTLEMLAGDLLSDATLQQKLATGFHRNHMLNGEGGRNAEESRVEYVVDRVETTATVWLGLTMGCGRCHSHKYDPISQKEFYRFYAYFNNIDEKGNVDRGGNANPVMKLPTPAQSARGESLNSDLVRLDDKLKNERDAAAKKKLQQQINNTKKAIASVNKSMLEVMVMRDRSKPRDTFLLVRGEWNKQDKSEKLFPGTPSVLPPLPKDAPKNRLALARWIVNPANPLTARVAVNRYWQHFFGTGLVKTVEDFGTQGERPSHPRLLDWLAVEFMESGVKGQESGVRGQESGVRGQELGVRAATVRERWNIKRLHRLIVLSASYRQSAIRNPQSEIRKVDPYNRLLSRFPRTRLTSQAIRDLALALSGLLVNKLGGPPVKPYQPGGVWLDLSLGKTKYQRDTGENLYRRSLYTFQRRSVGPTMFFDASNRQVCTVNQSRTNTPLHALTMMNDVTYIEAARVFAERVVKEEKSVEGRLSLAFRIATGRRASGRETQSLVRVFERIRERYRKDPAAAKKLVEVGESPRDEAVDVVELATYAGVANLILNLDEVMTKE